MNFALRNLLFSTLFLYTFCSITFRGVVEYAWVPNLIGVIFCFVFTLNLSKIKLKFNYVLLILLILVIWNLVTVFSNPLVFRYFITSFLIFILAFLVYNICATYPEAIEYIKWGFILSMLLQVIISNMYPIYTEWGTLDRHRGTIGNANLYAFFLNIMLVYLLQKIDKPSSIFKYFLIFATIGLVIFEVLNTGSRKGLFLLIVVTLFYYFNTFKQISFLNKIFYLCVGFFFIFQIISYAIDSRFFERFISILFFNEITTGDQIRISLYNEALRLFYENPILGWGGDGFRYFNNVEFTYSHINYMELLANYGLLGFICFYSMYIWFFKRLNQLKSIDSDKDIMNDKYIFIFLLFITLVLDLAMVRIFERIIWLLISMHLGKLYCQEKKHYNET